MKEIKKNLGKDIMDKNLNLFSPEIMMILKKGVVEEEIRQLIRNLKL